MGQSSGRAVLSVEEKYGVVVGGVWVGVGLLHGVHHVLQRVVLKQEVLVLGGNLRLLGHQLLESGQPETQQNYISLQYSSDFNRVIRQ